MAWRGKEKGREIGRVRPGQCKEARGQEAEILLVTSYSLDTLPLWWGELRWKSIRVYIAGVWYGKVWLWVIGNRLHYSWYFTIGT